MSKMRVSVRPQAVIELEQAVEFYESKRPGVGQRFASEVERVINRLKIQPLIHPTVLRDIRKAVLNPFPYCLYFRVAGDRLIVLAVFHTSRDPSGWRRRV